MRSRRCFWFWACACTRNFNAFFDWFYGSGWSLVCSIDVVNIYGCSANELRIQFKRRWRKKREEIHFYGIPCIAPLSENVISIRRCHSIYVLTNVQMTIFHFFSLSLFRPFASWITNVEWNRTKIKRIRRRIVALRQQSMDTYLQSSHRLPPIQSKTTTVTAVDNRQTIGESYGDNDE